MQALSRDLNAGTYAIVKFQAASHTGTSSRGLKTFSHIHNFANNLNETRNEVSNTDAEDEYILIKADGIINKKGSGAWYYPSVQDALKNLSVSWYYTWTPTWEEAYVSPSPGIEFVPMIQSPTEVNPTTLAKVTEDPSPNLLTFNEPDIFSQNPTLVSTAIDLWPQLEATGKRLGSPVTAGKPLQSIWFTSFMSQAQTRGLRIDFLNVHYFGENINRWDTKLAVEDFRVFLINIYNRYRKPIWVTEFKLIRWYPRPSVCPQAARQAAFAKAASEMMETLDFVERYSYFPLWPFVNGCQSELYETNGSITIVGEAYKSVNG